MATVNDIRAEFLSFFKKNGHEVRPSSSLVPQNDPTLMFTNAGMNQFKNVFTGAEKLPFSRAATSQKCVRAGGKHNDLDNVGYTARHHTFFEMLGNFSFGDYFKEDAIKFGWELLTKDYGLNKEKLSVTIYHTDDEAFGHWKKISGLPDSRIIRIATNDNFWSMGDTGPCGPCSEIFYDHGDKIPGGPPGSPDADGDRFVEIWNLVFMQYEQMADGSRVNLPKPSIDTGMGLERLAAVMQGVTDNYDIDLFQRLIANIVTEAASSGANPQTMTRGNNAIAHRVIADHLRSICFLMADGVLPSNEGRGYVLRRIMRRAMRYAHQMGCNSPLMYKLVPHLIVEMGQVYPELSRAQATITENLREEEERFKALLERGLKLLEDEANKIQPAVQIEARKDKMPLMMYFTPSANELAKKTKSILPGDVAFKLYDTYGFPLDLTQDILKGRGIAVDTEGFEKSMEGQRDMARAAHKGSGDTATGKIWFELKEKFGGTKFLGYDVDDADAKVVAIVQDGKSVESASDGEAYIILDQTPFYGESGGQVGDTGRLLLSTHKENDPHFIEVYDTKKPFDEFFVHHVNLSTKPSGNGKKESIKVGDTVHAAIYAKLRNEIRSNHSATHLLHKALRDHLGNHVAQKGSLVDAGRLRFDFSHTKSVSKEEIASVEREVNEVIMRNTPVECKIMSPDEAIKAGAMALFGEKYGDQVRVLSMGVQNDTTYSTELCGGTHVRATGDIGIFKITSEGSVASGIRRIEAVTGEGVRGYFTQELSSQDEMLQKLRQEQARLHIDLAQTHAKLAKAEAARPNADHLPPFSPDALSKIGYNDLNAFYEREHNRQQEVILALQEGNKKLTKELADARKELAMLASGETKPEQIGNIQFIGKIFDGLDPKELRGIAEQYLKQLDRGIVVVATKVEGKASVLVGVEKTLTDIWHAPKLVQEAVAELGGKGGGGKPEMAQGGGPDADKLEAALNKIRNLLAN